jgi:hypothetical protein
VVLGVTTLCTIWSPARREDFVTESFIYFSES